MYFPYFKNNINSYKNKHIINLSSSKVLITNISKEEEIYKPKASIEHFKITSKGLIFYTPINKLINTIIIKNSSNNEVAKIEFDVTNKKIIITSTGENSGDMPANIDFFILKLRNVTTGSTIKIAEILPNEDGNEFLKSLNEFNFLFDDNFLELNYYIPSKINITNYPNRNNLYIPSTKKEFYKITSEGLIAYIPQIKPDPLQPKTVTIAEEIFLSVVGELKFNNKDLKLIVFSFQVIANAFLKNTAYLLFKLRDSNKEIKYHAIYKADETLDAFAAKLNDRDFKIGDIIELDSISEQAFKIKNFLEIGAVESVNSKFFNLEGVKKYLSITENGLEEYIPTTRLSVDTLENTIIVNNPLNVPIITIEFNTLDKVLRILKFSNVVDITSHYDYFAFKLFSPNNLLICNAVLKSNGIMQSFLDEVNFKIFDYNYIIELSYSDKAKNFINITNFPYKNNTHIPTINLERYKITATGLKII